jgi:retron-type reverse transcriptase
MNNDDFTNLFSLDYIGEIFLTYIRKRNIIGIDNIDNKSFQNNIANYANHIKNTINDYQYSPYLEKLISKGRFKHPRIISIPTIKDRIVLYILKEYLHTAFPECVNTELINDRIVEIFQFLSSGKEYSIIRIDLKGFYDSINQKILLSYLSERISSDLFLSLIDKAITNPTVPKKYSKQDKHKFFQDVGVPQGLAISNILANIYLNEIDTVFVAKAAYYYRYVDDILIICEKDTKSTIYDEIRRALRRLGLDLNTEKSMTFSSSDDFSFLGYQVSSKIITIKPDTVQNHINSVFALLSNYKRLIDNKELREKWITMEQLVERLTSDLNEKITGAISENKKYGWLFYFSSINDKEILHKMNVIVSEAVNRILPKNIAATIKVKSYVRSFYEIKNRPRGGYINDYDVYDTFMKRRDYLNIRGHLDSDKQYTEDEINYLFITVRERNLSRMQRDIGSLS